MSNLSDYVVRRADTGEAESVALDFWRVNCDMEGEAEAHDCPRMKKTRGQVFNRTMNINGSQCVSWNGPRKNLSYSRPQTRLYLKDASLQISTEVPESF